jgi:hypothetical protein
MFQKPELRRQFSEWVEDHVQDLENDGAYVRDTDITYQGGEAGVSIQIRVPKSALQERDNDD